MAETITEIKEREIINTRIFNAPQELVFEAWTKPEHVIQWYGPDGFTITVQEMNVVVGGVWRFIMHGPDGMDFPSKIVFEEVVRPERLVYSYGDDVEATGADFHVTVTFKNLGDKTELTMRSVFTTQEQLETVIRDYGAIEGGKQTMNRLEAYLAKM